MTEEDRRIAERMEIDGALDTWLGDDLRVLEYDGRALWDGNRDSLHVREVTTDEAEKWHASRRAAINTGDLDAGEEDWLTFLLSVAGPVARRRRRKPQA